MLLVFALCLGVFLPEVRADEEASTPAIPPDASSPVVVLSPYEVVADRLDFRRWLKLSSPHFVVYTDTDATTARSVVTQLEMVYQASQFYLRRKITRLPPMIVVLPTRAADWRRIATERDDVEWEVQGVTVGSCRKLQIVENDWQKKGLGPAWRGLVEYQLETMDATGPPWFKRGIDSFFSAVTTRGDTLTMGRQREWRTMLERHGWIDWARFFRAPGTLPKAGQAPSPRGQFSAQAAVVVHYCLTHPAPRWTPRLYAWAAYVEAGNAPTEESFERFFGLGWKEWQQRLERMLDDRNYTAATVRFAPASLQFPVAISEPSAGEMRELFVLSRILTRSTKESDESLDALLAHGVETASLREVLADACGARGRTDAQLQELRRLIAMGSENPAVYADAAHIVYRRTQAVDTLDSRLGGEDGEQIRAWCRKAVELEPLYLKAAELLAWAEAIAPAVDAKDVETIAGISRALERNTRTDKVLAALAVAQWRLGNVAEARALAGRIQASVLSGSWSKEIADELLARMDATTVNMGGSEQGK